MFARAREQRSSAIDEGWAVRACALVSMKLVPYFAYGTTQKGFAHHRRFAGEGDLFFIGSEAAAVIGARE